MKVVCYRAVYRPKGDDAYDVLYPPECAPDGTEYVFFADVKEPYEERGWRIVPLAHKARDHRRTARWHKCNPHLLFPDADYTLWIDGSLTPRTPPSELVRLYGHFPVVTFDRIARDCAYAEAAKMARKRRDDPDLIAAQVARYRAEGYPEHQGLCATTAVLRKASLAVSEFNEMWWREIDSGSNRDQVSVNYCLWRLGMTWGCFAGHWNNSPHFTWRPHYQK